MSGHRALREKCGVFGAYAPGEDVARLTFYGIYALQHRGQESAGIATADGKSIHVRLGMGLVSQVFDEDDLRHLPGHIAIGHTRYSTTGSSCLLNAQPILVGGAHGPLAVAHNGNLVNADVLRYTLEEMGFQLRTSTDTEVIAHLLASAPGSDWRERVSNVMRVLKGAYSLVALTPHALLAMRDPWGIRPLCLGRLNGGYVVASETCALDHLGAELLRELGPGEAALVDGHGLQLFQAVPPEKPSLCVF